MREPKRIYKDYQFTKIVALGVEKASANKIKSQKSVRKKITPARSRLWINEFDAIMGNMKCKWANISMAIFFALLVLLRITGTSNQVQHLS